MLQLSFSQRPAYQKERSENPKYVYVSLIRLLSLFKYILDESGTAENKVE